MVESLLAYAVRHHDGVAVEQYLGSGVSPDLYTLNGAPLLTIPAWRGHEAMVDAFIRYGANVNLPDKETNKTAIFHVLFPEIASKLITAGACVNVTDHRDQSTMLHVPTVSPSIAEVVLNAGFNINSQDKWGNTALHVHARSYQSRMIELLLKYAPDLTLMNQEGQTALDVATQHNNKTSRSHLENAVLRQEVESVSPQGGIGL